ncbi:MAG: endo-1,4-beta-xylanase [Treponema sp.]|nr:endo-1,4-beta-xylanase [Treponema sp.]
MKTNKLKFLTALISAVLILASCAQTKCSEDSALKAAGPQDWMDADSLKSVWVDSGVFENIGFAVPGHVLSTGSVIAGIGYHATTITAENDFKPDSLMRNFNAGCKKENFTSSNGVTIEVPVQSVINFGAIDKYLQFAKTLKIRMRGHVLVWHSQTPKAFFCENFGTGNYVSVAEMDARQEWYIKSVLEHVKAWEEKNNGGQHIVYCWDVVNEAASDNCRTLREESDWHRIYRNGDYIVNAFRYANKYAPADVELAYNDYNEYQDGKHNVIMNILKSIIAAQNDEVLPARIDVAGMQSHMQTGWPNAVMLENTVKDFISLGLDVMITELDITGKWLYGNTTEAAKDDQQKKAYYDAFTIYKKHAKTADKNGVSGVTFWGLDDDSSWRRSGRPLIFEKQGSSLVTKPAFDGVMEASR